MNKTIRKILAIGTVAIVIVVSLASMDMPQAGQEFKVANPLRWSNEDLLLTTLARYTDVYHGLTDENEKEDLARVYLSIIIKDILVLPAKQDAGSVHVILPVTKGGAVTMVIKEIHLGPDNGLHRAMQGLLNKRRNRPPFYSPKLIS